MTTTYEVINIDDTNVLTDVDLHIIDPTDFVEIDNGELPDGTRYTLYQNVAGSDEFPMTARISANAPRPGKNGSPVIYNTAVKIDTFVSKDDGVNPVEFAPGSVVIAFNMPWLRIPDSATVLLLLEHGLSWLAREKATDVLADDQVSMLKHSVTRLGG